MHSKLNSVRVLMKENHVDLIALGPGTHMKWLLGFNPTPDERPCMLLIGLENEAFLMPSVNVEDAMKRSDIKMFSWKDENGPDIALVEALKSGHLRGAGIDVYAMEPPKKDHPFFDIPSIVVTPHIASNSDESFSRMGQLINCSVISYLNGEFPPNCVNPEVYPSD